MADTNSKEAQEWLQKRAVSFLKSIGLRNGQAVLDFGCNKGNFALPAARVVGNYGWVYALDMDSAVLNELKRVIKSQKLNNIECLVASGGDGNMPLPAGCVDVVLLYDVLHGGYFPEVQKRTETLRTIYRILKPDGILSLYPTHLKKYGFTSSQIVEETIHVGFSLESITRRRIVHDGRLVRGCIYTFLKRGNEKADYEKKGE